MVPLAPNSTRPVCYSLSLVTPPAAEPLMLEEVKEALRISGDDQDGTLRRLIVAARTSGEARLGQAFVTQTWDLKLDAFPCWSLQLPKPPLQSITSISYVDNDSVTQTIDAADYLVTGTTTAPTSGEAVSPPSVGWIEPAYGSVWPTPLPQTAAVTVRFVAGYGLPLVVPATIKQGMLTLISHWYEHREAVSETQAMPVPMTVDALFAAAWQGGYC